MKINLFVSMSLLLTIKAICQDYQPTYQSNFNLNFNNYICGVKYAYVAMSDNDLQNLSDYPSGGNAQAISAVIDYLKEIGFANVRWGNSSNIPQNLPSICDLVIVRPSWGYQNYTFTDITLTFITCNQDVFKFVSNQKIAVTSFTNIKASFYNKFLKMYGYKTSYYSGKRLQLPSDKTNWNEKSLKEHFQKGPMDKFEGIYESAVTTSMMPKYKLGVIKEGNDYNVIYLSGAANYLDWNEGDLKAKLTSTASLNLFKANWRMGNKKENPNSYITMEPGLMNLVVQDKDRTTFIKLWPTATDNVPTENSVASSGTGFGITQNGLIVTNSHVINGASKISVKGINGDFSRSYKAKLILEDKNNDLAIIQISDSSFKSLGTIPFSISSKTSDVGISVFTLGYPLKALMGDEIKLTNGIISSKSGFKGDVTSYQISAPLQPGNSGGPLFDQNGNLIGIVNSKLAIGENVSYAIKSTYLINLLDLLPSPPKLTMANSLDGKQLAEQVKIVSRDIFIIEVN